MAVRIVVGSGNGGGGGSSIPAKEGSITWEPSGSGTTVSPAINVIGASIGDYIAVSAPYDLQGLTCTGYVTAANTVKISLFNPTNSSVTLGSGLWKAMVIPKGGKEGSVTWSPNGSGAVVSPAITVVGAIVGDYIAVAPPYDIQGLLCTGYVIAPDTVEISLYNPTGTPVTLGQGLWRVMVVASSISVGGGAQLGTQLPQPLGVAAAGASITAAHSDHVHPMPTASQVGAAATIHTHTASQVTDLGEAIDDRVATLVKAGQNVAVVYDDVANTLTISAVGGGGSGGSEGSVIAKQGTVSWEPNGTGTVVSPPVVVTGAVVGDFIAVAAPYDLNGLLCTGYVTAPNTVEIALFNPTGSTVTLALGTWKVMVLETVYGGGGGGGPALSDATPRPLGAAAAGTGMDAAREDHVHAMPTASQVGAADVVHSHNISSINSLQTVLDNKANATHVHAISDVTNLQTVLDNKAQLNHVHSSSSITDFVEAVQDVVGGVLIAGANVILDYNDAGNTLTISTTSGASVGDAVPLALGVAAAGASALASRQDHVHPLPTPADIGAISSANFNEMVDDRVASLLVQGSNISFTYNDAANTLQISTSAAPVGTAAPKPLGASALVGTALYAAREDHVHALPSPGDIGAAALIHTHNSGEIAGFQEAVDDRVGSLLVAGAGINLNYNDAGNSLTITATGAGAVPFTSASRFVGAKANDTGFTNMTAADALAILQPRATPTISGGTLALNLASNREFGITMNQNLTNLSFQNVPAAGIACKVTLVLSQDNLGGRTVTWPGNVKFANGAAPSLSGANKTDIIGLLTFDGGLTWFGCPVGLNF